MKEKTHGGKTPLALNKAHCATAEHDAPPPSFESQEKVWY